MTLKIRPGARVRRRRLLEDTVHGIFLLLGLLTVALGAGTALGLKLAAGTNPPS